jgi:hypothetical protein
MTMIASLPLLAILCTTLWRAPFPIREATGQFEDIAKRPASSFLLPNSSYYRPIFELSMWSAWHGAPSVDAALRTIALFHIVPVCLIVLLFIWYLRPRSALDAAIATVAVAVLVGAPGFVSNLDLPLSITIVGMAAAIVVWILLERDYRRWHGPAIVVLTIIAVGFKEQGLALVPLVIAAWWMRAPGTGRVTAGALAVFAVGYVLFRLAQHGKSWPPFEQDVGFLFGGFSSGEAAERFGAFPLWIYLYSSASTVANVLFSEPTDGRFRVVLAFLEGRMQPWQVLYVISSTATTALIVWWGVGAALKAWTDRRWSTDIRLFVALIVVLAASGALSFDYSRERLGGMVVPFYAMAAFFAIRQAAERVARMSWSRTAIAAVALSLLAALWQCRAVYAIEFTRQRTVNSHREWITDLRRRRAEFSTRPEYLQVLESMVNQGTDPSRVVHRTRYPRWLLESLGEY